MIDTVMPREFVLLQGTGCRWRRCTFCDYHSDVSDDAFAVNEAVLDRVTGLYGVLDIINSGSAMELDERSISKIREVIADRNIHTVWFEAHYMYRRELESFAAQFAPAKVKFRCGVESFDPLLRRNWNKGIPVDVTPEDIASYFQGVCLLCCTEGDTKERILSDIATATELFEYFSVNIFCNNTTMVKRDDSLAYGLRRSSIRSCRIILKRRFCWTILTLV